MAKAIDLAHSVSHMNASKGPAVRALALRESKLYKQAVRSTLENQPNLALFQQTVADYRVGNKVVGVKNPNGLKFHGKKPWC